MRAARSAAAGGPTDGGERRSRAARCTSPISAGTTTTRRYPRRSRTACAAARSLHRLARSGRSRDSARGRAICASARPIRAWASSPTPTANRTRTCCANTFRHAGEIGIVAAFTDRAGFLETGCSRWEIPRFTCARDWTSPEELQSILDAAADPGRTWSAAPRPTKVLPPSDRRATPIADAGHRGILPGATAWCRA
jgi:hypothetical protein